VPGGIPWPSGTLTLGRRFSENHSKAWQSAEPDVPSNTDVHERCGVDGGLVAIVEHPFAVDDIVTRYGLTPPTH
jgi:hypothetical protein